MRVFDLRAKSTHAASSATANTLLCVITASATLSKRSQTPSLMREGVKEAGIVEPRSDLGFQAPKRTVK